MLQKLFNPMTYLAEIMHHVLESVTGIFNFNSLNFILVSYLANLTQLSFGFLANPAWVSVRVANVVRLITIPINTLTLTWIMFDYCYGVVQPAFSSMHSLKN